MAWSEGARAKALFSPLPTHADAPADARPESSLPPEAPGTAPTRHCSWPAAAGDWEALRRAFLLALPISAILLLALDALPNPFAPVPAPRTANALLRPPMGWNSWNHFGCNITEAIVRETADSLVSSGLAALGYQYVNIDDCWQAPERDEQGRLQADPRAFPSGIGALADFVHSKGLKLGVYSDAGRHTCAGRAGSIGHEEIDARTFAEWGVDFLKYDSCDPGPTNLLPFLRYKSMGDALLATGHRVVFSMCNWGLFWPALWGRYLAHADLWRTTFDIQNSWSSVMLRASQNDLWASFAGPGGWNDPDMLEVGNGQLSPAEERTHFSLWALMKAPLLIGCDVRNMSVGARVVITNVEAIAVNQDPLGVQAKRIRIDDSSEVWAGPLSEGREVVALVNKGAEAREIAVDLRGALRLPWADSAHTVRDIWKAHTYVSRERFLRLEVNPHDVAFLVLSPGVPPQ